MNLMDFHKKSFSNIGNSSSDEKKVPGARGFLGVISSLAYVYGEKEGSESPQVASGVHGRYQFIEGSM